jgi:hypothetical protein
VDAHALLASALKGFWPTREFPEIAEAQTLVTTLSEERFARDLLTPRGTLAIFTELSASTNDSGVVAMRVVHLPSFGTGRGAARARTQ